MKICIIENCETKRDARGLCKKHYGYHQRRGTLNDVGLPYDNGSADHRIIEKDEEAKTGVCSICGPVDLHLRVSPRRWLCGEKKRKLERDRYKYKFGDDHTVVTPEMRKTLEEEQNGLCAICRKPPGPKKRLNLDHCHSSGMIRGLLCHHCNLGIGHLKDDVELLKAAIEYLSKQQRK